MRGRWQETLSRADWTCAAAVGVVNVITFGAGARQLGFYYDDAGFLSQLPSASLAQVGRLAASYVPGRNLHVLWQYLLFQLAGPGFPSLPVLHLLQAALDGLVVASFYLLLRLLRLPGWGAVAAAAFFSFWPIHGETHFWLSAAPMNLLSTFFLIVFAASSVLLADPRNRTAYLWLLDGMAFLAALFTYDQVFFVLAAILALRLGHALVMRREAASHLVAAHLPHVLVVALFLYLKLSIAPGDAPGLRPDPWRVLWENLRVTIVWTFSMDWIRAIRSFYGMVSPADWVLAALVAVVVAALAVWQLFRTPWRRLSAEAVPLARLLGLAAPFYFLAYAPACLWYLSGRHHYLPSLGLAAAWAVCLIGLFGLAGRRWAAVLLFLTVGGTSLLLAAAGRGESRHWEAAYTAKKHLFEELKRDLEGRQVLVLSGFPGSLGPAPLISPLDPGISPALIYERPLRLPPGFTGARSGAPAPGGVFLHTAAADYGKDSFQYHSTTSYLLVRFTGWDQGRMRHEETSFETPPYRVTSSRRPAADDSFGAGGVATRQGSDLHLSLQLQARLAPRTYLAAVAGLAREGDFHRWDYLLGGHPAGTLPILLSEPGPPDPGAGAYLWNVDLDLFGFPATHGVRLDFYQVGAGVAPAPLGRCDLEVAR